MAAGKPIQDAILPLAKANFNMIKTVVDKKTGRTAAVTTKHDRCRVMQLRKLPEAAMAWVNALGTKTRVKLDAAHSHESDERDAELDGWQVLAQIFNDPDFCPQNVCCMYDESGHKRVPHTPRDATISTAALIHVGDLDPNMPDRALRLVHDASELHN